jgi:two-component system sensor histidine kinase SenX3
MAMPDYFHPLSLGLLGGVLVTGLVALGLWRVEKRKLAEANSLPKRAAELLELLTPTGMIINASNLTVSVTGSVLAAALLDGRKLAHQELVDLVNQARETSEVISLELDLAAAIHGNRLHITARAKAIGDGMVLLIVDDRTESHRLDSMRKDFMANISHELKTPIGAIGLLAEALENSLDQPETVAKMAKNIGKEAKRLSALVKDVIQLSRIQTAATISNTEVVNLVDVVSDAIDRNSWRLEKHGVTIDYLAPESSVEIYGDSEMLIAAVKNLIENAIIYSNLGSAVAVAIELEQDIAKIIVKDGGIGIPPSEQARVFERFYRVDQSRSRETGGTGLGLSIVKHAALSHMGDVQLFSKPGVGSTFTLRLPAVAKKVTKQTRQEPTDG